MPVLVVMADMEARESLIRLLMRLQLEIGVARSCREFRFLSGTRHVAAVVCDADLPDGGWFDVAGTLTVEGAPPLIVTSRPADDRLCVDALHRGALDMLAQPFAPSEVARVIGFARYRHFDNRTHPVLEAGRRVPPRGAQEVRFPALA